MSVEVLEMFWVKQPIANHLQHLINSVKYVRIHFCKTSILYGNTHIIKMNDFLLCSYTRYGIRCNVVLPGFIQTSMLNTIPPKLIKKVSVHYIFTLDSRGKGKN